MEPNNNKGLTANSAFDDAAAADAVAPALSAGRMAASAPTHGERYDVPRVPRPSSLGQTSHNVSRDACVAVLENEYDSVEYDSVESPLLVLVKAAYGIPINALIPTDDSFQYHWVHKATIASLWFGGRTSYLQSHPTGDSDVDREVAEIFNLTNIEDERNKRLNASVSSLWERFSRSSSSPSCLIPGFTGGSASIYNDATREDILTASRNCVRLLRPFVVESPFLSRSKPFDSVKNDYTFPDANSYSDAEVGYVSTRCSLAILSLFSAMSAVRVHDGQSDIFLRRLVSQPKVNVRPVVELTRIYDDSKSPKESGLMAACLGLCDGVDVTHDSMTCLAYSATRVEEIDKNILAPTINVLDDDETGIYHDCRVPSFVQEHEVIRLGELLFKDFHAVTMAKYNEWVTHWEKTTGGTRNVFHSLQLLSFILREFNTAYNGLRRMIDWQCLRLRLYCVAKAKPNCSFPISIPASFDILQQQVKVLMAALCPIRLAWLDGCGRMTTVSYLLSMRFPHAEFLPVKGMASDKFNLVCDESSLLGSVGKVHNDIRILYFSSQSSQSSTGAMADSIFEHCRNFSNSLLTSGSHAKTIGLGEFFKIFATKLEELMTSDDSFLKWNFEDEREEFVQENLDPSGKRINHNELLFRHPFYYWNFHQHLIRKNLFSFFYDKAEVIPSLTRALRAVEELFLGTTKKCKFEKSFNVFWKRIQSDSETDGGKKQQKSLLKRLLVSRCLQDLNP